MVGRVLLEDGDHAPDVRTVGVQRPVEVDDLGGVGVDARGVRVGDEVDEVVLREVDLGVGRGDRVAQVGAAPVVVPVALYPVADRRFGHPDPVPQGVRAQRELSVRGALEELRGGGEVVGGEFGGGGDGPGVGEREEDHDRVEGVVGAGIGAVPLVQAQRVVGLGPGQGAGGRLPGGGCGGARDEGGGGERQEGDQPGRHRARTRSLHPSGPLLTRHIHLRYGYGLQDPPDHLLAFREVRPVGLPHSGQRPHPPHPSQSVTIDHPHNGRERSRAESISHGQTGSPREWLKCSGRGVTSAGALERPRCQHLCFTSLSCAVSASDDGAPRGGPVRPEVSGTELHGGSER